jgi:hypothetical protein
MSSVEKFLLELCTDFPKLQKGIDAEMKIVDSIIVDREKSYGYLTADSTLMEIQSFLCIRNVSTSAFVSTPEKKHKVVKGYVQSKKTWAIISIALYYLFKYRKSSFIVVRNNIDDFVQIKGRITGVLDFLFGQAAPSLREDIGKLFYYLDISRGRCANSEELTNAFSGADPRIYICMRNSTDLLPLNEMLTSVEGDFTLIVDEVDDIDNGRDADSQGQLEVLKERAGSVWGVTATPMTSLMKDQVERGNVFILSRPDWYKDIPNFHFHDLPLKARYATKVDDDLFECDPNLANYLLDFAKTCPYECPVWKQQHPRISLIRAAASVEPQIQVAEYIAKNHPEITVITYNGSAYGITLRGKGVPNSPFETEKGVSKVTMNEQKLPVHHFSGQHISTIIGILEMKGVVSHPRIVVLAGKKADRGISFVSSSFAEKTERLKWHLTEVYLIAAKSTNQSNLLQIAGRLCGVFRDNVPLTLFSNVGEDIIKAYWVQDELIERARNMTDGKMMKDIIPEVPISTEKCSSRRITATGVTCSLSKVFEDLSLNGWDWEAEGKGYDGHEIAFGNGVRVTTAKRALTDEELEINREIHQQIREMRSPLTLSPEEVARITQKMFPVWSKANTKIASFIRNLDPRKVYPRKQLENECAEYGVRLTDCFTREGHLHIRTKYGNLFKVSGENFQLYPELVEAFEKNF